MNLKLIKPNEENKQQLFEMLNEWKTDSDTNHTNRSPSKIWLHDFNDYEYYINHLDFLEEDEYGHVPDTTLFCYDYDKNIFIGAVNIRHYLNEGLLATGGHIGDGIRPSQRGKGYGTEMIRLALQECKKLGIDKVLMTCDKNNIASAKHIMKNGGILENEVLEDGEIVQRYWIQL